MATPIIPHLPPHFNLEEIHARREAVRLADEAHTAELMAEYARHIEESGQPRALSFAEIRAVQQRHADQARLLSERLAAGLPADDLIFVNVDGLEDPYRGYPGRMD